MDFLLWVCRSMHMFGVVVWVGGLMFQNAVAAPIAQSENAEAKVAMRKMNKRFTGFVWMSAWTILITGILLMLFNPRFIWFQYPDRWSLLLGIKQMMFLFMVFYAFGYSRMLKYLESPSSNGGYNEKAELCRHRLDQFRTIASLGELSGCWSLRE
jgi:uncharacterized membrane protein